MHQNKPTLERFDTHDVSQNLTPLDNFFLFSDRDLYNKIGEQSNFDLRKDTPGQDTTDLLSKCRGFLIFSAYVDLGLKDSYWSYGLRQQNVVENFRKNNMKLIKKSLTFQ